MTVTVNKVSKYVIAKEVKDWALAVVFGLWGYNFVNDKFINPPKPESPHAIKINIDLGNTTEEQRLKTREEAIRFMEELGKIRQLNVKESIPWENAPPPADKENTTANH